MLLFFINTGAEVPAPLRALDFLSFLLQIVPSVRRFRAGLLVATQCLRLFTDLQQMSSMPQLYHLHGWLLIILLNHNSFN